LAALARATRLAPEARISNALFDQKPLLEDVNHIFVNQAERSRIDRERGLRVVGVILNLCRAVHLG
jgi:hypothetical protein